MNLGVLLEFNTILTAVLLLLMSIIIKLYREKPHVVFLLYTLLFIVILSLWKESDITRPKLMFAMFLFGLYGIITESVIISNTGVLEYKFPDTGIGINFPAYLAYIYASWVLVIHLIFKLVK